MVVVERWGERSNTGQSVDCQRGMIGFHLNAQHFLKQQGQMQINLNAMEANYQEGNLMESSSVMPKKFNRKVHIRKYVLEIYFLKKKLQILIDLS